jgi:hypothetical protein
LDLMMMLSVLSFSRYCYQTCVVYDCAFLIERHQFLVR